MKPLRIIFALGILGLWFLAISNLDNYAFALYRSLTPEEISIAEDLWNHPQPKTDVFMGIDLITYANTGVDKICPELNPFYIWEPGDFGRDVSANVQRNEYKINNVIIRPSDQEFWEVATAITRFEHGIMGKALGSHGGTISACIKTERIPVGLNMAEFQFRSTHGKLYSYNWAFKLRRENQVVHVEFSDSIWAYRK